MKKAMLKMLSQDTKSLQMLHNGRNMLKNEYEENKDNTKNIRAVSARKPDKIMTKRKKTQNMNDQKTIEIEKWDLKTILRNRGN